MRKAMTLSGPARIVAALSPAAGTARVGGALGGRREARAMHVYDASLAWAALLLLAIGVVMVYSSSIAMAEVSTHTGNRAWYFLARHVVFVAIGLVMLLLATRSFVGSSGFAYDYQAYDGAARRVKRGPINIA